jgi:hypothetical protein
VATDPPADLTLAPINGEPRTIAEWVTTFQLAAVVLDPFTNESAWIIDTAGRLLTEADCRVAFIVTGTADDARQFLGPWADKVLTFADPDRASVKALGLNELPAFVQVVQVRGDLHLAASAEGWDPQEWQQVALSLADNMSWSAPLVPAQGDPSPYAGSSAAG